MFERLKISLLLLVFVTAGCGAKKDTMQDDSGLTTKVVEFEKPQVGKVRIEKTFRGHDEILYRMITRKATTQALLLHGEPRYIEADNDGDGFFESVLLPGASGGDFEEFTRQPNGTLKPVSTPALETIRRQKAVADESLSKLLDNPEMTTNEITDLLETNRQKIEQIKNEQRDKDAK